MSLLFFILFLIKKTINATYRRCGRWTSQATALPLLALAQQCASPHVGEEETFLREI
jgi:hypothetical protein